MTMPDSDVAITLAEPLVQQVPCAVATPVPEVPEMRELRRDVNISDDSSDVGSDEVPDDPDQSVASDDDDKKWRFSDFRDPFYASTSPIIYALAACTITSYMLLIMLFVTPRSFFDGGIVYLGRRGGFTSGSGNTVTIGGRPWLQKVAALTVAVSLTIATADTMKVVKHQYIWSVQNARVMQELVMKSLELKITRIISSTFLWLAQAQTLIRLFPRHRERVIIKWVAFLLITLDAVFSILTSFVYSQYDSLVDRQPTTFVHPVPAMKYVFQLTLGLLYAAWVLYYSLMKRRYAFYHPLMKNICLVAIISIISVMVPIVFFILDLLHPKFGGWGDYVRWVGAAAASVVVWEWVERIEALEREEKKDGVLGREVFDGDDMLEVNASDFPWLRHRKRRGGAGDKGDGGDLEQQHRATNGWTLGSRLRNPHNNTHHAHGDGGDMQHPTETARTSVWPSRPAPAITPVSRTESASAASTVYAVRYQAGPETRTPDLLPFQQNGTTPDVERQQAMPSRPTEETTVWAEQPTPNGHVRQPDIESASARESTETTATQGRWRTLASAGPFFGRNSTDDHPPAEVAQHVAEAQEPSQRNNRSGTSNSGRWDLKSRLEEFAAHHADKIRERVRPSTVTENLPITVIPAPARPGAALQQVLEEEEDLQHTDAHGNLISRNSEESIEASEDAARQVAAGGIAPSTSTGTRSRRQPIPPNNPPLWPGVRPRAVTWDDEDDYSYDEDEDDSMAEDFSSVVTGDNEDRSSSSRHN